MVSLVLLTVAFSHSSYHISERVNVQKCIYMSLPILYTYCILYVYMLMGHNGLLHEINHYSKNYYLFGSVTPVP